MNIAASRKVEKSASLRAGSDRTAEVSSFDEFRQASAFSSQLLQQGQLFRLAVLDKTSRHPMLHLVQALASTVLVMLNAEVAVNVV